MGLEFGFVVPVEAVALDEDVDFWIEVAAEYVLAFLAACVHVTLDGLLVLLVTGI